VEDYELRSSGSPAGFVLEPNPTIGTTNWTSVTNTVNNDGSFKWVVVPANTGNRFYRLKK